MTLPDFRMTGRRVLFAVAGGDERPFERARFQRSHSFVADEQFQIREQEFGGPVDVLQAGAPCDGGAPVRGGLRACLLDFAPGRAMPISAKRTGL